MEKTLPKEKKEKCCTCKRPISAHQSENYGGHCRSCFEDAVEINYGDWY